ncbi:MAG TPA: hypothetical protein PKN52_00150 [Trueperaceae bacterium]|nr:hypothetical protein [Trueperaceae bacterium]
MTKSHDTREGWLRDALGQLDATFFRERGYTLPEKIQVSCGFPKGHATAIGQCFDPEVAADGAVHIFICPTQAEPIRILDILLHELIHAAVGIKEGHKGLFRKLAKEFGLAGKMTSTYAEAGSELHKTLEVMAGRLGAYPHAPMRKPRKQKGGSGWIRLKSPENERYTVVISPKALDEHGFPMDPWGNEMEPV